MKIILLLFSIILILLITITCTETELILTPPALISPEDGDTISQNPPTFIWQTVEETNDIVYLLAIATDSQFTINSIILSTMIVPPDTTYTPGNTLNAGEYYWHMCVREDC